jgi:hypothetical protein
LVEAFLSEVPNHRGLLLTACSGFTQYAYAFIDSDAERLKFDDYTRYVELQDRARMMYLRGRNYCLKSLELGYPGFRQKLEMDPDQAVLALEKKDVPLLYWMGASWGKAVSISLDRPELAGDFPIVRALIRRALELDEAFKDGAETLSAQSSITHARWRCRRGTRPARTSRTPRACSFRARKRRSLWSC